jgi:hypothetical protein
VWNSVSHSKLRTQTAGPRDEDTEGVCGMSARGSGRRLYKGPSSESAQIVLLAKQLILKLMEGVAHVTSVG